MLKMMIAGNLGANAEVRTLEGGRTVISFSVAHTDTWTGANNVKNSKTTWVRCSIWRNQGQSIKISDFLTTGRAVYVEGTPSAHAYLKDQNAVGTLELNVRHIELMGGGNTQQAQSTQAQPAQQSQATHSAPANASNVPEDDDLPF